MSENNNNISDKSTSQKRPKIDPDFTDAPTKKMKTIKNEETSNIIESSKNPEAPCHSTRFFKQRRTTHRFSPTHQEPRKRGRPHKHHDKIKRKKHSKKKSKKFASSKLKVSKKGSSESSDPSTSSELQISPLPSDSKSNSSELKMEESSITSSVSNKTPKITVESHISEDNEIKVDCRETIMDEEEKVDGPNNSMDSENNDEDVVNCICKVQIEDGLMIQCEQCLCWQHSSCMGLQNIDENELYLCFVCRDPRGLRVSHYGLNFHTLSKQGKLSSSELNRAADLTSTHQDVIVATHDVISKCLKSLHQLSSSSLEVIPKMREEIFKFSEAASEKIQLLKAATSKFFSSDSEVPDDDRAIQDSSKPETSSKPGVQILSSIPGYSTLENILRSL